MRILRAVMLAGALLVTAPVITACHTTSIASAQLDTAKGLYIAELAYQGFAQGVLAGAQSGALTGDKLATAKDAEAKAYSALQLARQGRASADSVLGALDTARAVLPASSAQ